MTNLKSIFRGVAIGFLAMQSSLNGIWEQPPTTVSNPAVPVSALGGPVLRVAPNGNGIAVWPTLEEGTPLDEPAIQSAYYARGFGWQPPVFISSLELNSANKPLYTAQADPSIALRPDGYAVAVWEGEHSEEPAFAFTIISARRNPSGIWDPVEVIGNDTGDFFSDNPQVSMNEAGTSLATWRAYDLDQTDYITARFLPFGGSWSAPHLFPGEPASAGDQKPYNFINPNGDAVVVWQGQASGPTTVIRAATYKATTNTWTTPVILDSGDDIQEVPRCSMDAAGNAVAVWIIDNGSSGLAKAAYFNGTSWEPAIILGVSDQESNSSDADVVMDLAGNATAIWQGPFPDYLVLSSSRLPNGTWTPPQAINTPGTENTFTSFFQEPLSVNPEGDVIATWLEFPPPTVTFINGIVEAAIKPFGQDWRIPETVFDPDEDQARYLNAGIASCGFAIALWELNQEGPNIVQASVNENFILPLEPLLVAQCCQKKKCVNVLTWPSDPCVLFYNIYCNGNLIASVFNTGDATLRLVDQNICTRDCVYTISAVNFFGIEGEQVPFTFL